MIRVHNGRLIQDLLVLTQEQKFCPRRGDTTPVPLMRRVQDIRLLAEKSISLIDDVLDDFRTSTSVLNSKR